MTSQTIGERALGYWQRLQSWDWVTRYVPEWAMADLGPDYEWTGAVVLRDGVELFEMRLNTNEDPRHED